MRKTIVLVADNAYLIPLETTIKSVLYHNKDVDFYILNNDIAPEWFKLLGKKMEVVNSTIKNIYIDKEIFEGYKTGPHINYATYFRFFAPEVVDADRILYIDSDLIVTGDLSPLKLIFKDILLELLMIIMLTRDERLDLMLEFC